MAIDYIKKNKTDAEYIGIVKYDNPYTRKKDEIKIVIFPFDNNFRDAIAVYNTSRNTISLFAYHINTTDLPSLYNEFVEAITHEMTHAIDIKLKTNRNIVEDNYLDRDFEFDGISAQITEHIKNNLNDTNLSDFRNWMRTLSDNVPIVILPFRDYINYWKTNKPNWFGKLIQRIYNEIFSDRET